MDDQKDIHVETLDELKLILNYRKLTEEQKAEIYAMICGHLSRSDQ